MSIDHVDVLIVGAGLSGIGAACHLQRECPDKTYAILESRAATGGTWDLFRYPGIRSDSDMFTLGYSFKPWTDGKSIADGPSILAYVREAAREHDVDRHIRFDHRVEKAEWSSETALWTVTSRIGATGGTSTVTASFLSVCSGYYRYDEGFTPEFAGRDDFAGQIIHPQQWPEDLDYAGKRVVVIGSGATAVTLLPAMAKGDNAVEHITMLQRSPTYISAVPSRDKLSDRLRKVLPAQLAYDVVRWKNVLTSVGIYHLSRRRPEYVKGLLRKNAAAKLPTGFDIDTHLSPSYDPWDQRLCATPSGELWRAISAGTADIVTDTIERFTPTGIALTSGRELPADIIVTATGLNLLTVGGLQIVVDGEPVQPSETLAYKGMMLSGIPNFVLTIGYTNASWTLKSDLVARYLCRLMTYMDKRGYQTVTPQRPRTFDDTDLAPLIDLKSGYVIRGVDQLPKQGPEAPWRLHQNYLRDVRLMRHGSLTDDVRFGHAVGAGEGVGLMATMRAQRLDTVTKTVSVRDVPVPEPGPGEVLIRIAYCGICHSDLSLIDGVFASPLPEITQGHEASGVIAALGPGVADWQVGDRVIPAAGRPDFTCPECKQANFAGCLNLQLMAFQYDGAWAEYTTALALSLTRVPDNVPMQQAAILADAVATPYGAVVNTAKVQVGESVGVWGLGGIGTHIVQIARLVGAAPIIALDLVPEVRERALELGADHALDPTDPATPARIRELTGGRGLDAAFDAVGVPVTFDQARWSVRVGGRLVVVGMSDQNIDLGNTMTLGLARIAIIGHLGYRNEDIGTLARLVSSGRLDLSRSVSAVVDLEDVSDGIRRLHEHDGNPIRILVRPGGDVD